MKTRVFIAVFLVYLIYPMIVFADGGFIPRIDPSSYAKDITEPSQKAALVWFNNYERLILQVSYKGNVDDFAWLVPVPSQPKISQCRPIFDYLHDCTAPRLHYWLDVDGAAFGLFGITAGESKRRLADPDNVDVLEQKHVGIYYVSVLKAKRASDLVAWLHRNDYRVTPKIKSVIDDYIRRGWVFTASRIILKNQQVTQELREGTIKPLMLDFETKRPVYPLLISSINPGRTKILLYTVAEHRLEAPSLHTMYVSNNSSRFSLEEFRYWGYPAVEKWLSWEQSNNHQFYVTKLTGSFTPKDMKSDLYLKQAKSDMTIPVKYVNASLIENMGAITLMLLSFPFGFIILVIIGFIRKNFNYVYFCFIWGLLSFIVPLFLECVLEYNIFGEHFFYKNGFWPVGALDILIAIWLVYRYIERKQKGIKVRKGGGIG